VFHDRALIKVQAGRGGDGSLHFRREKHVPKGGPDGGDGGPGGDVVISADAALRDLSAFRRRTWFKAGRGEPGGASLKHGATGETAHVRVPVGTQVFDEDGQLIADLASAEARVIVARGGSGKDVRQLFERQGALVSRVLRTRVGTLELDRLLSRGQFRPLTDAEITALTSPPAAGEEGSASEEAR